MKQPATMIARQLAERAEDVCRRYLSKGRREGNYWMVGDVQNTPGRSLYVRLANASDGRGRAGKWTDAHTGEHGDLLDVIAASIGARSIRDTLGEARTFLSLPPPPPLDNPRPRQSKAPTGTPEAARRLVGASGPIVGTVVETYLLNRTLPALRGCDALHYHPRCWYRLSEDDAPETRNAWPALIAEVTDDAGVITGVHRTWIDPATADKAPIAYPRRSMGHLLGHGVRFGRAGEVMTFGEGLETMLSVRCALPSLPAIAGTSAAHLGAILFPSTLRRLYVARDNDPAGTEAATTLAARAGAAGVALIVLEPELDDFNSDLRRYGLDRLRVSLRRQLVPEDRARFFPAHC